MKKSLLLYAVIFLVLTNLFTYMYYKSRAELNNTTTNEMPQDSISTLKKSNDSLVNSLYDANYFSLEQNQHAQAYFDNFSPEKSLYYGDLIPKITQALLSYNDLKEGNPYVGHEKMGEQKFIINKMKIINQRWIIADYSNGQIWGDVLIKYFVNPDESITFETIETFLHPKQ